MKRFFLCFCLFLCCLQWNMTPLMAQAIPSTTSVSSSLPSLPPMKTNAEAAALIDVQSGRIIYSQQGDKQMRIASLTKIMTAIVAIERGKLAQQVTISKNAFGKEGSSLYLKLGEEMSLQNLLYGLMLRSGNDAATAIAENVGGSEEGFAYMMNEEAEQLGMQHSHFMNPHGLDAAKHYASANDMAVLTAYALRNPIFQEIVKTKVKKVPNANEKWDYVWSNKNKMLSLYSGGDGVKTGYTKLARRCLVSSATRNGQQLVAVTLNDGDDWADHSRLLDYGFKYYPQSKLVEKGEAIEGGYTASRSLYYPLTKEESGQIKRQLVLTASGSVPSRLGEMGKLQIFIQVNPIGSVILYKANSPQLIAKIKSAFSYQPSVYDEIKQSKFKQKAEQVLDALFKLSLFNQVGV